MYLVCVQDLFFTWDQNVTDVTLEQQQQNQAAVICSPKTICLLFFPYATTEHCRLLSLASHASSFLWSFVF